MRSGQRPRAVESKTRGNCRCWLSWLEDRREPCSIWRRLVSRLSMGMCCFPTILNATRFGLARCGCSQGARTRTTPAAASSPASKWRSSPTISNWQRSARTHAWQVSAFASCDVIVDATGDPSTSLFLGAVAHSNGRAFVSAVEIFEGGIGGLVATCLPSRDPALRRGTCCLSRMVSTNRANDRRNQGIDGTKRSATMAPPWSPMTLR